MDASVVMNKVGTGGVIGLPFTESVFNSHYLRSAKGLRSNVIDTSKSCWDWCKAWINWIFKYLNDVALAILPDGRTPGCPEGLPTGEQT